MGEIKAMFIFEILGRPPEHLVKSLDELINRLGKIEGINILDKKIHEPKSIKGEKNLYTTFAEVEISASNLPSLFEITFRMLPAHVEIIEPEELRLKNFEIGSLISDLALKLHRYDEIAKALVLERNALIRKLKELGVDIEKVSPLTAVKKAEREKKEKKKRKSGKEK